MTIYSVKPDVSSFQYFLPEDDELLARGQLLFDCQSRASTWVPTPLYVYKPKLRRGNFLGVGMGGSSLACDLGTRDHEEMASLLEMSGELLPFTYEGEQFYIMNVLECISALDRDRSEWHPLIPSKSGFPDKYAFHRSRIPETPLFKIPETSRAEILCAENAFGDRSTDFKYVYERLKLTGLRFEKLWTNE